MTLRPAIAAARVVVVAAVAAAGCTGSGGPPPTPAPALTASDGGCLAFVLDRNEGDCVDTFELGDETYRVACASVPEILLDVPVDARWGRSPVRAIAAVATVHAVAVTANDEDCGRFALALRTDLPEDLAAEIVVEVDRAASLPPDLEK